MAELAQIMRAHGGALPPELSKMVSSRNIDELKQEKSEEWKKMQNIRVILRFRPRNRVEMQQQRKQGLKDYPPDINGNIVSLRTVTTADTNRNIYKRGKHISVLDHIFNPTTRQKPVFKVVGQPLIHAALGGFNATLFAYGQTGSGKTYSMFGANDDGSGTDIEAMGLIPRSFVYLFKQLEQKCNNQSIQNYFVSMQTLQIYNKRLLDLLNPNSKTKLEIKTNFTNESIFVKHLRTIPITSAREALAVLIESSKNRYVASHKLNQHSSRSHMLVLLNIKQIRIDGSSTQSNINFGDLAGSENISKAHGKSLKGKNDEERAIDNKRRREGISINASLSALTRCINKLVKGEHPGYRDSPLTHVLQDSLGGNSKTTLLVCASPHMYNRNETIRTLRFAATAKEVKNKAKVNQTLSVKALQKRIKALTAENAQLKSDLAIAKGKIRNSGRRSIANAPELAIEPQLFAQYSSQPVSRANATLTYQTQQLLRSDTVYGKALMGIRRAHSIEAEDHTKSPQSPSDTAADVVAPMSPSGELEALSVAVSVAEQQFVNESEEFMQQIATLNEQLQKEVQNSKELLEKTERQNLELDKSEGTINHLRSENQDKAVKIHNAEQEIASLQKQLKMREFVLKDYKKTFPSHIAPEYDEKVEAMDESDDGDGLHVPKGSLKMDSMDIQVETLEKYLSSLGSTQTDLTEFTEQIEAHVNVLPELRAEFTEKHERAEVFYDNMARKTQNIQSQISSMRFMLDTLSKKYDEDRDRTLMMQHIGSMSPSYDDEMDPAYSRSATLAQYPPSDDAKDEQNEYVEHEITQSQTSCWSSLFYCGEDNDKEVQQNIHQRKRQKSEHHKRSKSRKKKPERSMTIVVNDQFV